MKQEILEINSDVTSSTIEALQRKVERILDAGNANIEFSLKGVDIIDSTGIGFIIRLQNTLNQSSGTLVLSNVNDDIYKMMKLMRLDKHFTIEQ